MWCVGPSLHLHLSSAQMSPSLGPQRPGNPFPAPLPNLLVVGPHVAVPVADHVEPFQFPASEDLEPDAGLAQRVRGVVHLGHEPVSERPSSRFDSSKIYTSRKMIPNKLESLFPLKKCFYILNLSMCFFFHTEGTTEPYQNYQLYLTILSYE